MGYFLVVVFSPSWAGLTWTGAQPNCFGFFSLMSMFWSFLKGMHQGETFTVTYACIGRKPFWILIVLSLFNEWVGFAHFEVGVGCKYLSLAQWIKDAFCPVDVTICLTRWVNYCTLKTERKKRNAKTQHAVRNRCVSCGDWMFCLCRRHTVYSKKQFLAHKNHRLRKNRHFSSIPPSCHNILWILSVFRNALLFLRCTSSLDIFTQAYRHVRLASCPRHRSWPDTVLYTSNRCYWSVKTHQRPRSHVVTTSGQSYPLQSYLCSASHVSLQPSLWWFTHVSGQLGRPCVCKGV